ncbi:MAG: cell division protein FtsA [Bacteroidetes bacterium]|nr:cell division protein FtsA [Bacteroidota bacterium]
MDEVVVALDIGTTKICALAGRMNDLGQLEVLGIGRVQSTGVLRGVVANIDRTVKAIKQAVEKVERSTQSKIKDVYIGIAGQHIKSFQHHGVLPRDNSEVEISREDLEEMRRTMHKMGLPPGDKILHVIPQEYTVDNEAGINDPIGMSGIRLEANFHIITGQVTAFNNMKRCVDRAGLRVKDMTLEPIASAQSVLTEEEVTAGVALVDMGGGTTDLTVFHEGLIRHTAVIPFGGNVITKDIKEGCTVMQDQAEKLKVKFGSALEQEITNNRIITIPGLKGRDAKEISEKNLALIIQARVEEILDYVYWEIQRSGYEQKLIGGIVLTGGGSLLKNIDKLTAFHTGMEARIGRPIETLAHGYPKELESPIYSTGIGLLLKAVNSRTISSITELVQSEIKFKYEDEVKPNKLKQDQQQTVSETQEVDAEVSVEESSESKTGKPNRFDGLMNKVKEFFEATDDRRIDDLES